MDSDPISYQQLLNRDENPAVAPRNVSFAPSDGLEPLSDPGSPPAASSVVRPLADTPEAIRWMYRPDGEKLWKPFAGADSITLETRYQEIKGSLKHPMGLPRPQSTSTVAQGTTETPAAAAIAEGATNATTLPTRASLVSEFLQNPERRFSLASKAQAQFGWRFNPWLGTPPAAGAPPLAGEATLESANGEEPTVSAPPAATTGNDTDEWIFNKGLIPSPPPSHIVVVRGGLYEADLSSWRCRSTFWPCDSSALARGTWFLEASWEPLPMDYAATLEAEHLERFAETPCAPPTAPLSHSLPESPTKGPRGATRPVAHRVTFPEYHVDWTTATEAHLYRRRGPGPSSAFIKSVSQKLGLQWGERVVRGYWSPTELSDVPPQVGHVVFVVHGIGQKMDTSRIVRNCSTFRETVEGLQAKYFDVEGGASAGDAKIAVFLPIEWRSSLKLDGDLVESITPNRIVGLRQLLNTTAMDIMYYASPLYRTEIQSALVQELNRTFQNFLRRCPNFVVEGGKFSILAHSLGSVITYDIITCPLLQEPGPGPHPEAEIQQALGAASPTPRLEFTLEHFFCLGSPLAVFLALRWREPDNPSVRRFIIPDALCRRMYNIFDLNDPIGYRLEPLLHRAYVGLAPVTITSAGAPAQVKFDDMCREILTTGGSTRLQPPAYEPPPEGGADAVPWSPSNYFFDGETYAEWRAQKSPPVPALAIGAPGVGAAGGGGAFFSAIYSYWSQKGPPGAGVPPESCDGAEEAAAQLDKLDFQIKTGSFDTPGSGGEPDDVGASLSMNVGSSCGGSSSDFTTIGSGSSLGASVMPATAPEVAKSSSSGPASPPGAPAPLANDLDYRLDFVMRESTLPIPTGYLNALTSHTSYWSSPDIGFFVLAHLYNRIPSGERRRASDGAPGGATSPQ